MTRLRNEALTALLSVRSGTFGGTIACFSVCLPAPPLSLSLISYTFIRYFVCAQIGCGGNLSVKGRVQVKKEGGVGGGGV